MKLDLSLTNQELYAGCAIEEVAGRANLTTPMEEAVNLVGRNVAALVKAVPADDRAEVVLTGGAPIYVYLIAFHAVVHAFNRVYYDNGRQRVLVAAHG